jgi:hypothetical protein
VELILHFWKETLVLKFFLGLLLRIQAVHLKQEYFSYICLSLKCSFKSLLLCLAPSGSFISGFLRASDFLFSFLISSSSFLSASPGLGAGLTLLGLPFFSSII